MDDKTQLLVCLAAAVAANCAPCFAHYYDKALAAGMSEDEVKEAVALGSQIKQGSAIAMSNSVKELMGEENQQQAGCQDSTKGNCCC